MNTPLTKVSWLQQNINDPDLILLDASPASNKSNLTTDYAGQQIQGARFFDLKKKFSDLNSDMPNTLPSPTDFEKAARELGINQSSKIVVYDNLGIYTSPRVWWMFKAMGHEQVAVLDGGLPEWVAKGFTLEPIQTNRQYAPGNFSAQAKPELKKDMNDILENLESKTALVLDARSSGRFCGTAPEPRAGLSSGHMPGALSLPWTRVVVSEAERVVSEAERVVSEAERVVSEAEPQTNGGRGSGKMRPVVELKKIFGELNVGDRPLIFSCGSGLTACIVLLAAELAVENEVAVYDGSWTEWATRQAELVEKD